MKVWKYGDDINTDMLFPGKYTYTCSTAEEVIPHLLEDLDPSFSKNVKSGDIIFAGKNFGCGSSREQPVIGLKALGIRAIVAESFARIFFRAAINQGLVLVECLNAVKAYSESDKVELDINKGMIIIANKTYNFPILPDHIKAIRDAVSYTHLTLPTN